MAARGFGLATLLALVVVAPAGAVDQPVDGVKLLLKQTQTSATLVFLSRDPDALFPALGGPDDPTGSPGGALVEVFSDSQGSASFPVPSSGWKVSAGPPARIRFRNPDAPAGSSPVRLLLQKEGRVLKVLGKSVGILLLMPVPQGGMGIRVTMGSLRNCARFDAATIRKDEVGKFLAKGALASSIPDCSDASLGGGTTTTTSTTTSTTLAPCGIVGTPEEPQCGGACPAGTQCVGEISGQISLGCACLPDGLTSCLASGYPTCGGSCTDGQVCQGAHITGEGPIDVTICACVDPGDTCDDPAGTCFAVGVCPPGEVCHGAGPPTSGCACGAP
jgi:hypothetical protein